MSKGQMSAAQMSANAGPSFGACTKVFAKNGLLSFGGPAAQISLMHRLLVEENKWLTEKQFLNALSFCMLLPGPEAMQLATYAGWKLHGFRGGLMAGLLFVLPGAFVILALVTAYAYAGQLPWVGAVFLGIKAAVLIIVVEALLKVSKRALNGADHWIIALLAFVGIFFFSIPFPLIIFAAAVYGFVFGSRGFGGVVPIETSWGRTITTVLVGLALWLLPLAALDVVFGQKFLATLGVFFAKLAVVTFGGAYAVLAYMAQDVVTGFGWLTAGEMMDGLGLAETTPGPLILVTEFVAFLAAFAQGGFGLAVAAAAVSLWATFVPCFLWIFAGAPYIEWISAQPRLNGALSAITAAVVGVILNLSIWFGLHVLFETVTLERVGWLTLWTPDISSINLRVAALSIMCAWLLLKLHWGLVSVLSLSAFLGVVLVTAV